MTELEKIIERFDRGYTATLYGTVDLANFQKEYDFMELVQIVKKLTIPVVVKSLSQDNYCQVCKLPTDGEKCYSKRCPV